MNDDLIELDWPQPRAGRRRRSQVGGRRAHGDSRQGDTRDLDAGSAGQKPSRWMSMQQPMVETVRPDR